MTNIIKKDGEFIANPSNLSKEAIDNTVRALISLASSAPEADKVVQEFNPEFKDMETVECLRKKYYYITKLFGIDSSKRASCNPSEATTLEKITTDYYSLLSIIILRKRG
jgi:hypothetical protein